MKKKIDGNSLKKNFGNNFKRISIFLQLAQFKLKKYFNINLKYDFQERDFGKRERSHGSSPI